MYWYLLLAFTYSFSETIDYNKAIDLTIKNNKKLKKQKLEIKASKLDIEHVQSLSYGKLDLSHEMIRTNHAGHVFNSKLSSREASFKDFGFSQFGQPIDTQPLDLNYPDDRNNFNTKITYDIPLFTGFKLKTQEDILKIKNKAQKIKLNLDEKNLELEVLKAYNAAVVAKEFIKATQKAKEAVSLFVLSANEFYKEGLVTKIDKKQARVQELNVQSKIIEAKNNFDIALAYLRFLTSNDSITDVEKLKTFSISNENQTKLYKNAISNRDDLKIIQKSKEAMKRNIDLQNASKYPTVFSHLEYGFNEDKITFDGNKDYYLGMVGIKYNLFDNSKKVNIEKSQIMFNKTALDFEEFKAAIKLEVKKAILNLNAKKKLFREKKEAKELAFEILEQSKLMYKNQIIPMTELLKQEASFRENEASLIMASYEKSLAQAKLNIIIGQSLRE